MTMVFAMSVDFFKVKRMKPSDPYGNYILRFPEITEPSKAGMIGHTCEVPAGQVILE